MGRLEMPLGSCRGPRSGSALGRGGAWREIRAFRVRGFSFLAVPGFFAVLALFAALVLFAARELFFAAGELFAVLDLLLVRAMPE
jgi:hypothetical protein